MTENGIYDMSTEILERGKALREEAGMSFLAALRDARAMEQDEDLDESSCLLNYHQGQSAREVLESMNARIEEILMRPHGDDGASDHPVEECWMRFLGSLLDGSEDALEMQL